MAMDGKKEIVEKIKQIIGGFTNQPVHLLIFLAEPLTFEFVFDFVLRRSDFLSCSEDRFQRLLILSLDSLKDSVSSFPWGRERLWLRCLSKT